MDVRTPPNRTIDDIVDRLRIRASETPESPWIIGRGYDDTGVADMRHPTRDDLDGVTTIHDASVSRSRGVDMLDTYESARDHGVLKREGRSICRMILLRFKEAARRISPLRGKTTVR